MERADGDLIWRKLIGPTFKVEYARDPCYGAVVLTKLLSQVS